MSRKKASVQRDDADDDIDDKLTDSVNAELERDGVTDLEAEEDDGREYDTDEKSDEQLSWSDDEARSGDEKDGDIEPAAGDGDDENDEDYGAAKKSNGTAHSSAMEEDGVDDDAEGAEDEGEVKQPKKKAAKKSTGQTASAAATSTPKKARSGKKTSGAIEKRLAALKKEREEANADETQKKQMGDVLRDYIIVATVQAVGDDPGFCAKVLKGGDDNEFVARLGTSVSQIRAHVQQFLTPMDEGAKKQMEQIRDFVVGALVIENGDEAKARAASVCDITNAAPKEGDELICLRAVHRIKGSNALQPKHQVVLKSLRQLIEQLYVLYNPMTAAEKCVHDRLEKLKGKNKQLREGNLSLADVLKLVCDDTAQKASAMYEFFRKLNGALIKINIPSLRSLTPE